MKETMLVTGGNGGLAKSIASMLGQQYKVLSPGKAELDVSSIDSINTFFNSKKIDVLINNAGNVFLERVGEMNTESVKNQIDSNLTGAILCSNAAVIQGAHTIINIGSTAGCVSFYPGYAAYSATKAGLVALTRVINSEGIKSACISPARINTPFRNKVSKNTESPITLIHPDTVSMTIKTLLDNNGPWGKNIIISKPLVE